MSGMPFAPGLVAITAGCDLVSPLGAAIIGLAAGIVLVFSIEFIDTKLHIDDPVGASSVHGVCGILGTILTGLFALDGGALYGGGFGFFGAQCLGILAIDGSMYFHFLVRSTRAWLAAILMA